MTADKTVSDATLPFLAQAIPTPPASNLPNAPHGVAFAVDSNVLASEGGTDPVFGSVTWKTLISGDRTATSEFVLGIAEFGPFGTLNPHRHAPAEFYLGIAGSGIVTIDGTDHQISAGVAIYVPGNAEHATVAGQDGLVFAYGFAEAAFTGIEYLFSAVA
ncbi:MAG: cupin domain-containing protein [Rhodobacteraceae bacterium]|nr:cupin domain-containing protein [Paracoccaceae bacterium]